MAGIYIHIPYCSQACHYCDFHFSTNLSHKATMVSCIAEELHMQRNYLQDEQVDTIYLGGGTPSLLTEDELSRLLKSIYEHFAVSAHPEITLEANPENITTEVLQSYVAVGINRLSLGVQTFHPPYLQYLNRIHSSEEAMRSLELIAQSELNNYSADLIFGIKEDDLPVWENDLRTLLTFEPQHISAYNLTIEERTVFGNWLSKGKINAVSDEHGAKQFEFTREYLVAQGYEHYEISNYGLPGYQSRHNTSYWKDEKYLGVGPGAHSYNRTHRRHNLSNNNRYIQHIQSRRVPYEEEQLSREDKINERIITGLRTSWGCDLEQLKTDYSLDLVSHKASTLDRLAELRLVKFERNQLLLTPEGQLVADAISTELMM